MEQQPWDPACRQSLVLGGPEPPKVGKVEDVQLSKFDMRVFTPEGGPPEVGWPVFIYLHGGESYHPVIEPFDEPNVQFAQAVGHSAPSLLATRLQLTCASVCSRLTSC